MFACVCPMNLCCFIYMYETLLCCSHVWMAPGKISCKLTWSTSLNKVSELNWIEYTRMCVYFRPISKMLMSSQVHVYLRNKTFRFHISIVHILKVLARTSKSMHPHLIHVHIRTHTNTHAYTQTRTHTHHTQEWLFCVCLHKCTVHSGIQQCLHRESSSTLPAHRGTRQS